MNCVLCSLFKDGTSESGSSGHRIGKMIDGGSSSFSEVGYICVLIEIYFMLCYILAKKV